MECSQPLSCQCQPIAKVNVLGAQLTHIELSFHRAISVLSISLNPYFLCLVVE